MVSKTNHPTITAIVPAYNEAARIGPVLDVLVSYPRFLEIIVIDDGSTDGTEGIARGYPITYLKNEVNRGKGESMERAAVVSRGKILFFCDADIRGLSHRIIDEIIAPVAEGRCDMFIGMRNRKIYILHFLIRIVPLLGGERALRRELWERLPARYKDHFKIEPALNFYASSFGNGFGFKIFKGLSKTIKERKYGWRKGLSERLRLYHDLIETSLCLRFRRRL